MGRPKATKAPAASTTVRRPFDAGDRTIYTHNLWLNYLKPVSLGLVVSPNALRVAQVDLPLQSPEAQNALLDLTVATAVPEDEDTDASVSARILPDLRAFLILLNQKSDHRENKTTENHIENTGGNTQRNALECRPRFANFHTS